MVFALLWTGAAGLLVYFGINVSGLAWDQFRALSGDGVPGTVAIRDCSEFGDDPGSDCTGTFVSESGRVIENVSISCLRHHSRGDRVRATVSRLDTHTAYERTWFSWVVLIGGTLIALFLWAFALLMLYPVARAGLTFVRSRIRAGRDH